MDGALGGPRGKGFELENKDELWPRLRERFCVFGRIYRTCEVH